MAGVVAEALRVEEDHRGQQVDHHGAPRADCATSRGSADAHPQATGGRGEGPPTNQQGDPWETSARTEPKAGPIPIVARPGRPTGGKSVCVTDVKQGPFRGPV